MAEFITPTTIIAVATFLWYRKGRLWNFYDSLLSESMEQIKTSSIQLIAGRTGQEYNLRKNRKEAYWEDRYHATAVEIDRHLIQCILCMDMNMVRAGVSRHPADWPFNRYNEIQAPRARYGLTDYEGLIGLLGFGSMEELGIKGIGRKVIEKGGSYELREFAEPYKAFLGPESEALRLQNAYFWNNIAQITIN